MNMHNFNTKCNQCNNHGYYYSEQNDKSKKMVECPACLETRKNKTIRTKLEEEYESAINELSDGKYGANRYEYLVGKKNLLGTILGVK